MSKCNSNSKMKYVSFMLFILSISLLVGCNNKSEGQVSSKQTIAVSIPPQVEFINAVAKDEYEIITMVPPGNSAENYEPSPMQMEQFSNATIYFSIGVLTEENNIIPSLNENTKIVNLHEKIEYEDLYQGDSRDPHIWLSPKRVKNMIEIIKDELTLINPQNEKVYQENADKYISEIDVVDSEIKTILNDVQTKKFIVFHPAFGYIADEYGLEMFALEEHGKEATAVNLQEMIDFAKLEEIKTIFYQSEIDSSQAEAFAEEIGGKTVKLEPLAQDYLENLRVMAKTMSESMN